MVIKGNGVFSELLPIFQTGILTATTKSDSKHDVYIMRRDDYFNQSEINYSKAISSTIGVLNSYIEKSCNGTQFVIVVKNNNAEPVEVSITLEHMEQKQIFTSAFGGRSSLSSI